MSKDQVASITHPTKQTESMNSASHPSTANCNGNSQQQQQQQSTVDYFSFNPYQGQAQNYIADFTPQHYQHPQQQQQYMSGYESYAHGQNDHHHGHLQYNSGVTYSDPQGQAMMLFGVHTGMGASYVPHMLVPCMPSMQPITYAYASPPHTPTFLGNHSGNVPRDVSPPGNDLSEKSRSFINQQTDNCKNVYVRNLPLHFDDAKLRNTVQHIGEVVSVKAIMNRCAIKNENGETEMFNDGCKGYGFIMFAKAEEASAAISFLNQEGYRASMAKASISSKLRGLQDSFSCNLYFANIPQSFDEKKLSEYLRTHLDEGQSDSEGVIESVRVLRSHDGQSKRVGFARFSHRKAAERIMSKLNGTIFDGSNEPAHVRFADNGAQKMLKAGARNIGHGRSSNDSSSCASMSTCHFYDVVTSQSDFNESTSSVGAWL